MFICENLSVNPEGHLLFAGMDTVALAEEYGTPVYLLDEDRIRSNCRTFRNALSAAYGENAEVLYASKACAFTELYRILQDENIGVDVVSAGEIHSAKKAGYDLSRAYFHGNNKTDSDLRYALASGIGCIVVDNEDELRKLSEIAGSCGITQKILIRITPGIDTHTYEAVNTGKVDSKFGNAIATGAAEEIVKMALSLPNLELAGLHCHVGSQVFGEDVFERTAAVMIAFLRDLRETEGYVARELDLGGGFGVPYTANDGTVDLAAKIASVSDVVRRCCGEAGIPVPKILIEPGRSIVADAGMTLYSVGSVKTIPGYKTYVSVDGGMTDNPRYALYRSKYTCYIANRMNEPAVLGSTICGRCCESGDLLAENVPVPASTKRDDILAVCTTGAYNYSMASVYNRIPRPPVVMLHGGTARLAVRRETLDDLTNYDL